MKKIVLKGKEYPCRVSMGAMVRFKRESGKDVSELKETDISDLVLFMWCCVCSACNADDVQFDYSFEKFADTLEPSGVNGFYEGMKDIEKKNDGQDGVTADIDELMGIAMGCIGMSMQDFCQCTPSEFMSIYKAWIKSREQTERNAWERARISCLCSLQPYSKKRLKATDIMEFPWEKEKIPCNREKLSASEEMERYKAAKRKYGLT